VIEDQTIVTGAGEFPALEPRQRRPVAMARTVAAHAMPGRRIAAGEVALCAGAMIAGEAELVVPRCGCRLAPRRGWDAAVALAVVEAADHDRPVDVALEEAHQHFLPGSWQELAADAGTGVALAYAQPAAVRRSEEHTSELQSRENLVCRLLLE